MQRQILFCRCIAFTPITEYGINTLQAHLWIQNIYLNHFFINDKDK